MKSARQLFHSGPLITTPCPDWLPQTGQETDRKAACIQITSLKVYTEISKTIVHWHSLVHLFADQPSCGSMCAAVKCNVNACIEINANLDKRVYESTVNKQKTLKLSVRASSKQTEI